MREFRKSKDCTERYSSLEEMRAAWGLKPVQKKRPKTEEALKAAQEKFLGSCRVCKHPLVLIDGCNAMACKNPECRGIKMTSKNEEDGTEKVWYIPVTRVIDERGMEIAGNLFD